MNNLEETVAKVREICRQIEEIENNAKTFYDNDKRSTMLRKEYDCQKKQKIIKLIELIKEAHIETI